MRMLKVLSAVVLLIPALVLVSCKKESSTLAGYDAGPYSGSRGLFFTKITVSPWPDIQWLGGRVKALGVNRGPRAALDSTLVWLRTAGGDDISSLVRFGQNADQARLTSFGASRLDSLADAQEYTFWLATSDAFDAKLDSANTAKVNHATFVDSTYTFRYWLVGGRGGEGGTANPKYVITVRREENFKPDSTAHLALTDTLTVYWNPAEGFRQIALNEGSTGSLDAQYVRWHILAPAGQDIIKPPIVIGRPVPGTQVDVPYTLTGLTPQTGYVVWVAKAAWNTQFTLTTPRYAFFRWTFVQ